MAVTLNANTSTGFIATSDTSGVLQLQTSGTTAVTVDASQNVGIGVTPSAWGSGFKALQIGARSAFFDTSTTTILGNNTYYDGSNYKYIATAGASLYDTTAGLHRWYNAASGTAGNTITFTQAMTLDASGNLGLGTSSPQAYTGFTVLTVDNATNGGIVSIRKNGTVYGNISPTSNNMTIDAVQASASIVFRTGSGSDERARIASGGQFCVNTTNTNGAFNVSGNVYLFSQSAGAGTHFLKWNSGTGQVTYDSSSRLVKDNIVDSPYGLAEVMQLKSRKYLRIDDQRDEIGLIADEVQAVMPEFVPMSQKSIFTKNEEDTELVPSGVYYEKLSSVLIKAIQEQQAIIQTLTDRITALEGTTP
jgi:hypothetical protein